MSGDPGASITLAALEAMYRRDGAVFPGDPCPGSNTPAPADRLAARCPVCGALCTIDTGDVIAAHTFERRDAPQGR